MRVLAIHTWCVNNKNQPFPKCPYNVLHSTKTIKNKLRKCEFMHASSV